MLLAGELSAVAGMAPGEFQTDNVGALLPNPEESALRALDRSGFYPINHLIVMTESIVESHPELPVALFECFTQQKKQYLQRLSNQSISDDDEIDARNRKLQSMGFDPLPYGVAPTSRCSTS